MAFITASKRGSGGGPAFTGWKNDVYTVTAAFTPGSLYITLSQTPLSAEAILVEYNGAICVYGLAWTFITGTNQVQILFGDEYFIDYDTPPIFQIHYPY